MKRKSGGILLAIMLPVAILVVFFGVNAGGAFAQSGIELTVTDIQADAPGDDRENLNGESITVVIPAGDRTVSEIENTSEIDVSGYTISFGDGEVYELEADTVPFGTKFVVSSGSGRDLVQQQFPPIYDLHANFSRPVLNNEGGTVTVRNAEGEVVDRESYGNEEAVGTTRENTTGIGPITDRTRNENNTMTTEMPTEETTETTTEESGDSGEGKAKSDDNGTADGGNGKSKISDGSDGTADGGNGKSKNDDGTVDGDELSDEVAKERALAAEEVYITQQLKNMTCLTVWDFGGTVQERATVTNRTADSVYVNVTHPYAYIKKQEEAVVDTGTNARYVLTSEGTRRVRGDSVSPC